MLFLLIILQFFVIKSIIKSVINLETNYKENKGFRLLNIYERLNKGETVNKQRLADEFGVAPKTIQRDIDDLRAYLAEEHFTEIETSIRYDKAKDVYYLVRLEREWLTNEEATALCKILLESRAFNKTELSGIIEKLIMQIAPEDRKTAESIIRNEYFNYVPLKHEKNLLSPLWQLSKYITEQKEISFYYHRQDGKQSKKLIKPVSILFSEFYFYLIGFDAQNTVDYPIVFRVDRMVDTKPTDETFTVPYKDKFNDGEFRKRIQFMYSGELKTVKFYYSGVLEAILDRLPTAKILEEKDGVYLISAETYGDGIYMWLRAQEDNVKII